MFSFTLGGGVDEPAWMFSTYSMFLPILLGRMWKVDDFVMKSTAVFMVENVLTCVC